MALIIFSAVSLATLEFLKNVFPARDALLVSKTTVVYMIILAQILPALVLLAVDRLIAARDSSGRGLRVFRTVLFVVAILLIARQLQLYWGRAEDFADSVRSAGLAFLVLVDLAFLMAIIGLAIWLYRGLLMFFYYMSPVAIVMTAIIPFQMPTSGDISIPEAYGQEVVTSTRSESQPAVFILVFDEMGYDILLEGDKLDEESFPNFAALAEDGVWFTNATSNYFWSKDSIPTIFDPLKPLAEDFNIRLYIQYLLLEARYFNDCGNVITCRGITYLTENDQLRGAGNLTLRAFYEAAPRPVEKAISRPMGWLLDRLGWEYPSVSRSGGLTLSKRLFSLFLDDIEGESALGRIYALHLSLPHRPFVFDREGDAIDSPSPVWGQETFFDRYREQVRFVDRLFGELLSKLKREGIYGKSVIVLTSDHGPRPFTPTAERLPHHDTPRVPLVIHAPGLNSHLSDVDYQHIDFGPTLTDILGLPPLDNTEGVSAFSEERPQRDKVFHVDQWTFVYSQEDDSWQ
ncbi:MAG: sulfatase-like hydrolase/transferase, partial [Acidobacteria bacterium]|nr:sulfatase-like hydrolase/transferase [Acidobacteriota bacterium]